MESYSSSDSLPSLESLEITYVNGCTESSNFTSEDDTGSPRFLQPRRLRKYCMEPASEPPTPRDPAPTITVDWDRDLVLPTHNLKMAWGHIQEAWRAVGEALKVAIICARLGVKMEAGPALRPDIDY